MGLIKDKDKLTTEFVLNRVDEGTVFGAYFGHFSLRKPCSSPFRRDRTPSAGFFLSKSGKILFKDFGTDEKMDCFAFVAKLHNITYAQAIKKVACDFGLIECKEKKFTPALTKKAELITDEVKKETLIDFTPAPWSAENLAFWQKLSISQAELEIEDIYPVDKLFINEKFITNWRTELRYAFVIKVNKKVYTKIYTPYAHRQQFKWISNIPLHIPFGINKLSFKTNQLIISKAAKERLLWRKFFPDVIATQNENPSALNSKSIQYINKKYDQVFTCFDHDATGLRNAEYFMANHHYTPIPLPPKAVEKHGIKDWAQLVEIYGINSMEKYLKHLELI